MQKKLLCVLALLMVTLHSAMAQTRTVTGRVTTATDGSGLPGVTIVVKGTSTGASTGVDGSYSLSIPETSANPILVFSFIGMNTQEIVVGTRTAINVALAVNAAQLEEVVVVGYGTQERREVTGATAKVTSEDIANLPVVGVDQALQGRAAGVQISQNSGTPGGGISVRVRGSTSISASNQPLYVVDGVPLTTGDFSQLDYGGQSVNAVTDINPNDIESIDILKDASAAAIYGSRAANGVVLITTKRGSANKTQVNFNAYYGTQSMWRKPDYLNAAQYQEIMTEAYVNDGELDPGATFNDFIDYYYEGVDFDLTDTDWIGKVTRSAPIQNYEVSLSGGDAKTRYYLSGNFFDQQGTVIGSEYKRYSTRLNLDHSLNDKVSIGASIQLSRSENNRIVSDNTVVGPFANALASSPIWPIYYEDGTYTRPNNYYTNPIAEATENDQASVNLRALGNIFAKYNITKALALQVRGGYDAITVDERRYTAANYPGSSGGSVGGEAVDARNIVTKRLLEATASYNKLLAEVHNISAVIGTSTEKNVFNPSSVLGQGFAGEQFRYVSSAARVLSGSNAENSYTLVSFFGRINYSFKEKYLLGINFRADGSSRFGENNRYGYFPSISAGWRVLEEKFLSNVSALSELKLRASYGKTGNQEIGNYSYQALVTGSNYLDNPGIALTQLPNPDLKWESTSQLNLGADIGVLKGRINLAVDYYVKKTDDLLFSRAVPTQNGFASYQSNIGSTENKGWEFALNTINLEGSNGSFGWTSDFNIAFNKNKITSLYEGKDIFYGFGGNSIVLREGQPIGTFYGYISDGIFASTDDVPVSRQEIGVQAGDVNFRDLNGDGIITDADLTIIGNAQPKFTGGFNNTFRFKGFDLNVFTQFVSGNKIANPALQYQTHLGNDYLDDNMRAIVLDRWRAEGDITDVPRATVADENDNNRSNQSRFVLDGSYLRFKNVILGYSLPKTVTNVLRMRSLRVYAQAQNLLTFTNYTGFDPEVNYAGTANTTLGVDFYTVPQARTFTFGINVGF